MFFDFGHPRHVVPLHRRGFAFDRLQGLPKHPRDFRQSVRHSGLKSGQGAYSAATREALLTQLEQLGFRDVPELLRRHGR